MALRIPPRRSPAPVTLVQALNHICGDMIAAELAEPDPSMGSELPDLAAVIARDEVAARRAREHGQLATEVAEVLLEAIGDGRLSVEGVPDYELIVWRSRPGIFDWPNGRFTLAGPEIPYTLRQFHIPLVSLSQAVALFEEQPEQAETPGRVAIGELRAFVHETTAAATEKLTEPAAKDLAERHFAPARFTARQWSDAWRDAPNKRGRGEKGLGKSDA